MANSYHMEALRKQRLLDRKNEALRRLEKQGTDLTKDAVMDGYLSKQTPKESPLITDEGQFNQQRSSNSSYQYMSTLPREEGVVFGEVVHDPNFKYRILKSAGSAPVHVDPIHKIMYPDPCHLECSVMDWKGTE
ncbi:uncharacterized protein [Haliotis cracherodii]|uniref:uncharacterized protein isoform X2 n=1 Tax=Haliotis cracherodii TaxID=6455 RepID=UPI0039EBA3E5